MNAGEQIGKYRLERELGAGGMGTVWLAHDTELDRRVALKVLRPALAGDDTAQARLLREARAMAKLRHANVITVFDAETIAGRDLVAMELVEGSNMAAWLASERTEDEILETLLAAGRGLAAAHAAGMVHRDFKPANVLVEKGGRVLVTDFGLARADARSDALAETMAETPKASTPKSEEAKSVASPAPATDPKSLALEETAAPEPKSVALDETAASDPRRPNDVTASHPRTTSSGGKGSLDSDLTRTGTLLGTPAYMAPEQIRGTAADARADQFAFCVTAWEALAGKRPFPGEDVGAIAKAIERGDPVHADKIPRRIRPLLQRGLTADPAKRWPSMEPLLAAIHRAWQGPKKQKQWAQAIGLGVFGFIAIFVLMSHVGSSKSDAPAAGVCRGSSAIETVWSPAARAKLAQQMGSGGSHSLAALDRWATTWTQIYDANCANPKDSDFELRKICLESQRDSLALLVQPEDSDGVHAVTEADLPVILPSPEACQNAPRVIAPPLPKDPAVRSKVQKLRSLLFMIRTRVMDQGFVDRDALLERANAAIAEADGMGDPTLRSDALGLRALVIAFAKGEGHTDPNVRFGESYKALKEATEAAEASGNDRTRIMLLVGQLEMASRAPGYWGDLDDLLRRADLGVQHVQDPVARLLLDELRGIVSMDRGRWTDAIERFEKARHGWLERGSEQTYVRFSGLEAATLLLRHADGDLQHGLDILAEADHHDLRPSDHQFLAEIRATITGSLGTATPLEYKMLGVDAGAGSGSAMLTVEVTGLSPGTTSDDGPLRVMRRALPDALIEQGSAAIRPPAKDPTDFFLQGAQNGRYDVLIYISTAAGDMQVIRRPVTVEGPTTAKIEFPAARELVANLGPTDGRALWGIALALPKAKPPTTAAALRTMLATAPWWSVTWVHTETSGTATTLSAELGALGSAAMTCTVSGGTYNNSSPTAISLGSDSAPVHCSE